jgi:transcriptional regulator with XRE-family HTH domain
MNNTQMGDLIAELRKQKNMTQKDLADKLNVTDKAVSKWERNLSCPDIGTIPLLAQTLGITSEELLTMKKNTDVKPIVQKNLRNLISLILKAVALAMGISTLVNSYLGTLDAQTAIRMLSIGLICISLTFFGRERKPRENS